MKITLLGTGTPIPSLNRSSSSYMVEAGSDVILFDHGPGAFQRLMQTGKKAQDVTHVFLSHLHFDHCGDLPRLVHHQWDAVGGLKPRFKIYGPPGTQEMMDRLFGPQGAYQRDLTARTTHPVSIRIYQSRGGGKQRPWPETQVTEIANGTAPDVFWIPGTDIARFQKEGLILDLAPLAAETDFDVSAFYPEPMFHLTFDPEAGCLLYTSPSPRD